MSGLYTRYNKPRRSNKKIDQQQQIYAQPQMSMPIASEMAYVQQQQPQQPIPQYMSPMQQQPQFVQPIIGYQQQTYLAPQASQDQFLLDKIAEIEKENEKLAIDCENHRNRIQYLEDKMFDFYSKYEELQKKHPIPDEMNEMQVIPNPTPAPLKRGSSKRLH